MIGPGVTVLTVPAGYWTPSGAIRKARAAQFALDARAAVGWSGPEAWVLHLDDTAVGRDTAIEVARFITANRSPHDGLHPGPGRAPPTPGTWPRAASPTWPTRCGRPTT